MFRLILCFLISIAVTNALASTLYLKAKSYLDVQNGMLIQPANILIENSKIIAINPKKIPIGTTVISKPDLILLPGLMDMHVHLTIDYDRDFPFHLVQDDASYATLRAAKNAQATLMAGFTTVRNVGQIYPIEDFIDVALSKASKEGWVVAPHIIPAGHALSMTGGHMDPDMFGGYAPNTLKLSYRVGIADGIDEIRKAVRYQIKHGAQMIKFAATAGVLSQDSSAGDQQYSDDEMKAIVDEAKRHHVYVAAHAHGAEGIKAAIKADVRSIEHGSLLDDECIKLMKEKGTYLIPTTYLRDAMNLNLLDDKLRSKALSLFPLAKERLRQAIKANVNIAFGTDAPIIPHGENAKEFQALVKLGMSPINAIRTATIHSATMMGISDRGEIRIGFKADIIGVKENPLSNVGVLEKVSFVMKDGNIYKDI